MASTASAQLEKPTTKPSFAKVAASAYMHRDTKQVASNNPPQIQHTPVCLPNSTSNTFDGGNPDRTDPVTREEHFSEKRYSDDGSDARWVAVTGDGISGRESEHKGATIEGTCSPVVLAKPPSTDDDSTQLSSSGDSAKPPSLDGKSVASGATFALDEKESLRPDDSASLRAVEEEDGQSLHGSIVAGSRVESENGDARAFRDQLREISVMGPLPHRGGPPGRFPAPQTPGGSAVLDSVAGSDPTRPLGLPPVNGVPAVPEPSPVADPQLLEALASPRDRLFVLKLEQDLIDFVNNSKENELNLPNCNSFYRMLAHRLADYYLLGHLVDDSLTAVKITKTSYCRIPPPLSGLSTPATAASTPPIEVPARKIMRRGEGNNQSGTNTAGNSENPSKTTSEAGGSGSDGGDASANESKKNASLTREEREAKYLEARQRIFGDTKEIPSPDANAGNESKDVSRSSSASGKKKGKKQRNNNDDGFEARSQFNAYYAPSYGIPGYATDGTGMFLASYGGQMANAQYQYPVQQLGYSGGYAMAVPQEAQVQSPWMGQNFSPTNVPMPYSNFSPNGNSGYDLSADFQRGMQSFQSSNLPSQMTPKMAASPMANYPDTFRSQTQQVNQPWTQLSQQTPTMVPVAPYMQNSFTDRPVSASSQSSFGNPYPYGQLPGAGYSNNQQNRNQHPLPGSYNRQQFNPQSQAFIPGGCGGPFSMQPAVSQMQMPSGNNYTGYPMNMNMPNPMLRPSPPSTNPSTFGSPRIPQNNNGTPSMSHGQPVSHPLPQPIPSHPNNNQQTSTQQNGPSAAGQSSIAKWGTPAHLPPKPPPPASQQTPKFSSLPGHNFPAASRLPNAVQPAFGNNGLTGGGRMTGRT